MAQKFITRLVTTPPNVDEKGLWTKATIFQFIYSLVGLIFGLACVVGGIILFFRGVTGATSWTAKFFGGESTISDAAPGVILFIVGLFFAWITRFNVEAGANK